MRNRFSVGLEFPTSSRGMTSLVHKGLRGNCPAKGRYRAERLRRRGSKCLLSAPQPLCVRYFPVLAANGSPPMSRRISPPQRQRRCAIQAGVVRVAALPRVQVAARSLPRKGLCRSCPPGGAGNKGGMKSGSRVRKRSPPGMYCQYPRHTHLTCHSFEPSAQPRWGCLCLWPLPGVAPRRRNPGLYGRIPVGFPEGGTPAHTPPWDSRPGKGGRVTVSRRGDDFCKGRETIYPRESTMGISGPPQNVCSECPFTEGGLSRREAETQRIQMPSLRASAPE